MFKITPIQDKNTQAAYCKRCGAEYREGFFGYAMLDAASGELMGLSQFEILGEVGYIKDLKPLIGYTDYEAMFILGRSTMNFIDLCGAHKCSAAPDAAEERLLHAIGFRKGESGDYFCDMTGLFDGHCDGNAVELK